VEEQRLSAASPSRPREIVDSRHGPREHRVVAQGKFRHEEGRRGSAMAMFHYL